MLVSPAAHDRWLRWREELQAAQLLTREKVPTDPSLETLPYDDEPDRQHIHAEQEGSRRAHSRLMEQGLFNEAQPTTPPPSDNRRVLSSPGMTASDFDGRSNESAIDFTEFIDDDFKPADGAASAIADDHPTNDENVATSPAANAGLDGGVDGGLDTVTSETADLSVKSSQAQASSVSVVLTRMQPIGASLTLYRRLIRQHTVKEKPTTGTMRSQTLSEQ